MIHSIMSTITYSFNTEWNQMIYCVHDFHFPLLWIVSVCPSPFFLFLCMQNLANQNRVNCPYWSHSAQWQASRSENVWGLLNRYQSRHCSLVQIDTDRWKHHQQMKHAEKGLVYSVAKDSRIIRVCQDSFINSYTYLF